MKNLMTALLTATVAAGALTACQTTSTMPNNPAVVAQPLNSQVLQAYQWQLVDAKRMDGTRIAPLFYDAKKPLILQFATEVTNEGNYNRLGFMNTCNSMGATYAIQNGNVELSNMLSTKMMCAQPEQNFDDAALAIVQGKYSITKEANQAPMLTIQNANTVAQFKAVTNAK
ncbi:MAG: META domain-containing protein [Psychrobacter sp.]|nr:META domain-containing protein [Psychrobacter sp.]